MAVITSGHPPILPSLGKFGSAVAPRRGREIYRSGDFFLFYFYFIFLFSDARPDQTRRPIWARSTSKDVVSRKDESFWGMKYMGYKFRGFYPQNPPKFPPKSGFSTLNSNAAVDLSEQYAKRRGFTQGGISFLSDIYEIQI